MVIIWMTMVIIMIMIMIIILIMMMTVMMRKEVGLARRRSRDVEDKQLLTPPPPRLFCQHRDGRGGQRGGQGQQQRGQVNTSTANSKPLSPGWRWEDKVWKLEEKGQQPLISAPVCLFHQCGKSNIAKVVFLCLCVWKGGIWKVAEWGDLFWGKGEGWLWWA